jgi:hypothetical protein
MVKSRFRIQRIKNSRNGDYYRHPSAFLLVILVQNRQSMVELRNCSIDFVVGLFWTTEFKFLFTLIYTVCVSNVLFRTDISIKK